MGSAECAEDVGAEMRDRVVHPHTGLLAGAQAIRRIPTINISGT